MPHHQVQRLVPRHFRILDLMVAGHKTQDIARVVGCRRETVYAVSRSPLFIAEYNRRMRDRDTSGVAGDLEGFEARARSILNQKAEAAAETQVDLLDSDDDSIRLRASTSILDRVLGKNDGPSGGNTTNIMINSERADLLLLALQESQNGVDEGHTAHSKATGSSEDGQNDVHQTPVEGPWSRPGTSEAQDLGQVMVPLLPRCPTISNGSPQETPQPERILNEHDRDETED